MSKTYLILIISLLFSFALKAQEFSFGVKSGINYYSIGELNSRGGSIQAGLPDEVFSPNKDLGTQFGAFLNIEFDKIFFRPELNLVSNNNTYDFPNKPSQWRARKIEIPLLAGYKIFGPVSIYVGPSFSFFDKVTLEGADNNTGEAPINFYKSTTNLNFGILLEFKRFGVDLRYGSSSKETEEELSDIHNSAYGTNLTDIRTYKPSQISMSLNFYVFRTNSRELSGVFAGLFNGGKKCHCPYR